jgi:AcrR family transcriptional regulator
MLELGPRARRRRATIDEVLTAARDLAREHGLASISMRELGARVGLHASSLYQYFPSKDAIYDALFARGHRELHAWMTGFDRTGKPVDVLKRGSRHFTEFCLDDEVRYQLLFQRTIPGFTPSEASMDLAWQSYRDLVAALADAGVTEQADIDRQLTAVNQKIKDCHIQNFSIHLKEIEGKQKRRIQTGMSWERATRR